MPNYTPNYNIPYPVESDPWDITAAFQNMAEGIDTTIADIGGVKTATTVAGLGNGDFDGQFGWLSNIDCGLRWDGTAWKAIQGQKVADTAARSILFPSPVAGDTVFRVDGDIFEKYSGSTWIAIPGGASTASTVPISQGGTGATTIATAQTNLQVGLIPIDTPTVVATGGTAAESGLNVVTFTNCTDIRLQGIFTSAYRNYRIVLEVTGGSANASIYWRAMSGSTPQTTTYNYGGHYVDAPGTSGVVNAEGSTEVIVCDNFASSTRASANLDILAPQVSTKNMVVISNSLGVRNDGAMRTHRVIGERATVASYDGILLRASTGTFSGVLTTYGYNN